MAGNQEILLVVGAGSGMGQECALFLAGKGFRVIGSVYLEKEAADLAAAAKARGVTLETVRMDVTQPDQVKAAIGQIGRVDGLVYFAGISLRGFVEDLSMEDIKRVFEVNYYGALHCIQAVLPGMRERKAGRLVITTSAGGRIGSMSIGGYVSSKFAVEGLVECLAQEVAMFNIHCSLLEPGLIKTPHFTVHRNRAPRAMNPESPYYSWFLQHEKNGGRHPGGQFVRHRSRGQSGVRDSDGETSAAALFGGSESEAGGEFAAVRSRRNIPAHPLARGAEDCDAA